VDELMIFQNPEFEEIHTAAQQAYAAQRETV